MASCDFTDASFESFSISPDPDYGEIQVQVSKKRLIDWSGPDPKSKGPSRTKDIGTQLVKSINSIEVQASSTEMVIEEMKNLGPSYVSNIVNTSNFKSFLKSTLPLMLEELTLTCRESYMKVVSASVPTWEAKETTATLAYQLTLPSSLKEDGEYVALCSSWNNIGTAVAVAFGRPDVGPLFSGFSPVAVHHVRSPGIISKSKNGSSCVILPCNTYATSLVFHSGDRSLLAVGGVNGEVSLWFADGPAAPPPFKEGETLQHLADRGVGAFAKSRLCDATHRTEVRTMCWLPALGSVNLQHEFDADAMGTQMDGYGSGKATSYEECRLLSICAEGKGIIWTMPLSAKLGDGVKHSNTYLANMDPDLLLPLRTFSLMTVIRDVSVPMGCTSVDVSSFIQLYNNPISIQAKNAGLPLPEILASDVFIIVGTEGGVMQRGRAPIVNAAPTVLRPHDVLVTSPDETASQKPEIQLESAASWRPDALQFLSSFDTKARFNLQRWVENALGTNTDITMESLVDVAPPASLFFPPLKLTACDPHAAHVSRVAFSPFTKDLFASSSLDGTIRIFRTRVSAPLLTLCPATFATAAPSVSLSAEMNSPSRNSMATTRFSDNNKNSTGVLLTGVPQMAVSSLSWSPHRSLVIAAGTYGGGVAIFDLARSIAAPVLRLQGSGPVVSVEFSSEVGRLCICYRGGGVDIYDLPDNLVDFEVGNAISENNSDIRITENELLDRFTNRGIAGLTQRT